jgi:hypothetical protein
LRTVTNLGLGNSTKSVQFEQGAQTQAVGDTGSNDVL